jgi:DNA-binding NtrC family response regulator
MTASARSRVFVVDDDRSVADMVAMVLHQAGFQVTTFYDAVSATQYALECEPHTVVTDFSMPHMNGLELAAWLQDHFPDCKIVIISGEAAAIAEQANDGLKFTLLQKPVKPQIMIAAVR